MRIELDKTCTYSAAWLQRGFSDAKSDFTPPQGADGIGSDTPPADAETQAALDSLFSAIRFGNHDRVLRFLNNRTPDEALTFLLATIKRIEAGWRDGALSQDATTEAFWTVRRILDHHLGKGAMHRKSIPNGKHGLLWVPPGDTHTFGAQFVSDELRQQGWKTTVCLQESAHDVLDMLAEGHFDLLGISIGYDANLLGMSDFITDARLRSHNPGLKVVAGGAAIAGDPKKYAFLCADLISNQVTLA